MYDVSEHRVVLLEIVTERINEVLFIFFQTTDGVQLLEETVVAQEDVWVAARINNYLRPELLIVELLCRLGLGLGKVVVVRWLISMEVLLRKAVLLSNNRI